MRSTTKLYLAGTIGVAVLLLGYVFRFSIIDAWREVERGPIPEAVGRDEFVQDGVAVEEPVPTPKPEPTPTPEPAPETKPPVVVADEINLKVVFVQQAPTSNWDAVHEETCEEASVLMIKGYMTDVESMTAPEIEAGLADLIEYEMKTFGYFQDTTVAETVKMMQEHVGLTKAHAVEPKSMEEVREFLRRGVPVIMPAAGKLLGNPNFKNGGPLYHMLVIKGFRKDGTFITNDPGTRRGADYVYSGEVLWKAMSDWDHAIHGPSGVKRMIVVE